MSDDRLPNYSPFAPEPARPPHAALVVFLVTRLRGATVETMTGSLRAVAGERWEALYLRNGDLYSSQVCLTRQAADAHLTERRAALEAAGWTRQPVSAR